VRCLTVGIAGTAKNTGKTTTISYLMDEVKKDAGLTLGLTSIGYDGENFDNVTGLPKPRIDVWPGVVVAVAEKCLGSGGAGEEVIARTDVSTPLGRVVIGQVSSPGKQVLAGANNSRDLRTVLDAMRDKTDLVFVDGALSRIAPMAQVDCLILVTGAARTPEIHRIAAESGCIVDILSKPVLAEQGKTDTVASVLNQSGFADMIEKCSTADTIQIQGVVNLYYLEEMARIYSQSSVEKRLIFADPLKLLLAGDAIRLWHALNALSAASVEIGVANACKLLAMTVNPYYPKYRYNKADYQVAYVDSGELLESVRDMVKIPCFDVVQQGGQEIFKTVSLYKKSIEFIDKP
jgi:hypothetical protein